MFVKLRLGCLNLIKERFYNAWKKSRAVHSQRSSGGKIDGTRGYPMGWYQEVPNKKKLY